MKRRRADLAHLSSYDAAYKALWQRIKRGGKSKAEWLAEKAARLCAVAGCGRKFHSKGYCTMHYRRFHLYGNPLTLVYPPRPAVPKFKRQRVKRPKTPKEFFSDMTTARIRVSHSILRNLGKGYDR